MSKVCFVISSVISIKTDLSGSVVPKPGRERPGFDNLIPRQVDDFFFFKKKHFLARKGRINPKSSRQFFFGILAGSFNPRMMGTGKDFIKTRTIYIYAHSSLHVSGSNGGKRWVL